MKIAIGVDPHFSVPPQKYGGSERSVAYLIDGLVALGHDVTLFGPGNSQVPCQIIPCSPANVDIGFDTRLEPQFMQAREQNIKNILQYQDDFDVISWHGRIHKDVEKIHQPATITIRNPLTREDIQFLKHAKNIAIIALSKSYMENYPQLPYHSFIYNGLPIEAFPFTSRSKEYMSFVGRFSKDKQPHIAMQAALALKKKLIMGARLDRFGQAYFEKYCQHYMDSPFIDYRGEVTEKEKIGIVRFAEVNLHPIFFPEPFGLSVVEAGLCGTPTIAFDKGSMQELIVDGVSGYVVKNLKELLAVYPKALLLERKKVRKHFVQFSHMHMAKKYVSVFEEIRDARKSM